MSCFTGAVFNSGSNVCTCPVGQYSTSNATCAACPANCTACADNTGVCTTCKSSYTLNIPISGYCGCQASVPVVVNDACTALGTCLAGTYNKGDNRCYACPAQNCATCNVYTGKCNACKTTFSLIGTTCICIEGTYKTKLGNC